MPNPAPTMYMTQSGWAARVLQLLKIACIAAYEDNCFGIAKGAAYSALLSVFPVLTSVTAILVQARAEAVSRVLGRWISEAAPPGSEELLRNFLVSHGERPFGLLVGATV